MKGIPLRRFSCHDNNYICAGKHCFNFIWCKLVFSHLCAKGNWRNWVELTPSRKAWENMRTRPQAGCYSNKHNLQASEGEDLSEYFQAFSISVLHFCGAKSSHRISCTVFHLSELFRCRIMVSIGTFVFCYSAANLRLCRFLALIKKFKRWILDGFYLLPKFFLYCLY